MYDFSGDGWADETWTIYDSGGNYFYQTFLVSGDQFTDTFVMGTGQCNGGPITCGAGTSPYIQCHKRCASFEISWYISNGMNIVQGGGAPYNSTICLGDGCYYLHLLDQGADGWNGATYTLIDLLGTIVTSGSLQESLSRSSIRFQWEVES